MTTAALNTLIRPFSQGVLDLPKPGERWAFFNAAPLDDEQAEIWKPVLTCEQGFRGSYLDLEQQDYSVLPNFEELNDLDGALVLASRVRQVNEDNIARAWQAVRPGGTVVYCGDKNAGAISMRKWVGRNGGVEGSLSKNHAVVFWQTRTKNDWPVTANTSAKMQPNSDDYQFAPGMFSASGPDKGSQLLAEQFSNRIFGRVADFGAGWGYLSAELLKCSDKVEHIDLFEADWASLQAARENVSGAADFHWVDLTREPPKGPFNWIIMNPPFHSGRAAEPDLGLQFITTAAKALPAGGRLLMVANTNLPYEATLQQVFKKVEKKAQRDGFKVIEAVKGSTNPS